MRTFMSGDLKRTSTMLFCIRRHLSFALKHITPRKAFNALVCLCEMQLKRAVLTSHPLYLRIDVCPYCNLHCPGCLLGGAAVSDGAPDRERKRMMKYELFKESVADFVPYLIRANLYDEGEPLLNREIFRMIEFLSKRNVSTCVSSNFSFRISDRTMEEIVSCGLEHLIVAVDGATRETYSRYRKGGNLDLVVSNIERLLKAKKKQGGRLKVEMQFIDFENDEEERQAVSDLAQRLGVWRFAVIQGSSRDGWAGMRFIGSQEERRRRGCYELWISATINSEGEMYVCDYGEDHGAPSIGLGRDYLSGELRNHPTAVRMRRSFGDRSVPLDDVCKHCSVYRR